MDACHLSSSYIKAIEFSKAVVSLKGVAGPIIVRDCIQYLGVKVIYATECMYPETQ